METDFYRMSVFTLFTVLLIYCVHRDGEQQQTDSRQEHVPLAGCILANSAAYDQTLFYMLPAIPYIL